MGEETVYYSFLLPSTDNLCLINLSLKMKINACVILYDETTTLIYFKERKEGKEIEMPQEVQGEPEKTQAKEGMRA